MSVKDGVRGGWIVSVREWIRSYPTLESCAALVDEGAQS
jgi:hypothetical protein